MAESHSEDSPLLGSTDPPSPGECSPSHRGVIPSWPSSFHSNNGDASTSSWSKMERRPSAERLHVLSASEDNKEDEKEREEEMEVEKEGEEEEEEEDEEKSIGPKLVHSQASMDSGCDCDPSETEALSQVDSRGARGHRSGYSPLSSSAADEASDDVSSPGPSGCVAPLAQKESLDCQCGALDQKCVCETSLSGGGGAGAGAAPLLHTDRGELPKVTFRIEGYDEEESYGRRLNYCCSSANGIESSSQSGSEPGDDFRVLVKGATMMFPKITSFNKSGMLSASSSTASMPMCRICHFPQGEGPDSLISPCRCSGTMQFIHESCLKKWLDVSKSKKAAACELCNYQYNRHKKFRLKHWELPSCSRIDKILHSIFLLCLIVMATCATITIYCFKQDRFTKKREGTDLTKSEIVTLTCGVLFFVAFFMAMYVEVKAKDTLYRLFSRFLRLNQTWHIDEYDKQRDNQHAPV